MKKLICIMCPRGCNLIVDDELDVTGNLCPVGKKYAINEMTNPCRILTSTVKIKSQLIRRLPVITTNVIPKNKMKEVIKELDKVFVQAPIKVRDVIINNILGLGVDIVSSRSIDK